MPNEAELAPPWRMPNMSALAYPRRPLRKNELAAPLFFARTRTTCVPSSRLRIRAPSAAFTFASPFRLTLPRELQRLVGQRAHGVRGAASRASCLLLSEFAETCAAPGDYSGSGAISSRAARVWSRWSARGCEGRGHSAAEDSPSSLGPRSESPSVPLALGSNRPDRRCAGPRWASQFARLAASRSRSSSASLTSSAVDES
jgi:hypothetical protein